MDDIKIIDVNQKNISQYPPVCFLNPQNEGYLKKLEWIKKRFSQGLRIKLLYLENNKKLISFIEYMPGEFAWRAVAAKGYMFIHCIWITPNKNKGKGYGSILIKECIEDARAEGKQGVVVVASEGSFMAGKALFLKNGFKSVASVKPSFELMVKTIKREPFNNLGTKPLPKFKDWEKQLRKYQGLNFIYADQCPWIARSIKELSKIAKEKGFEVKITEFKSAKEAQNAPSVYGTFNLVFNGKLLADHYISTRRFLNIIEKELRKK